MKKMAVVQAELIFRKALPGKKLYTCTAQPKPRRCLIRKKTGEFFAGNLARVGSLVLCNHAVIL
jgi:hypothetical protein